MNQDVFEGKWEQLKGKMLVKWGKLTDDDMMVIDGNKDQLIGKLRQLYGLTADQVNQEFGTFMKDCNCATELKPKPIEHSSRR